MQRAVLLVAIVLAVFVDGFFAVANFLPVAPPRDRGPRKYVLMQLDDDQIAWFQHNILDEYNEEHTTNLFARDTETAQIAPEMNGADVVLAVLPSALAVRAAADGLAVPFEGAVAKKQITKDFEQVVDEAMKRAQHNGRQYFLPRAVSLQVAVYRISRVRDAMLHWNVLRPDIEAVLRTVNGRGLPADYELEQNPSGWDSYDQFVFAYYWAHRSYNSRKPRARMAHRTGLTVDAQLDISSSIFRSGASNETFGTRDSDAAVDAMQWEALYREHGLYSDAMFVPGGLDDEDALNGIAKGRFYFASIDEVEAFSLHGGGHRDADPLVRDEDDLGFVAMPRFASLELDAHGLPQRTAQSFSFREEIVWALPAHSADAALAYDVVRWAMDRENHARECEAIGMLPIRRDVIQQRATLFREPWMQDVFEAGLSQWDRAEALPPELTDSLGLDYAVAWDRIVKHRGATSVDRNAIATALRSPIDRAASLRDFAAEQAQVRAQMAAQAAQPSQDAGAGSVAEFRVPPLRETVVIEPNAGPQHDAGVDAAMQGGRP